MRPHKIMGGKKILRDLVIQRIYILRDLAYQAARQGDIELALTAGNMIFRLAMRNSIRIPSDIKRSFCKECRAPLIPGITSMVRIRSKGRKSIRITTCLLCFKIHRLELN